MLGSTLFSQPEGRSLSVRAKLLMTFTSLLECWYLVKRVWSLRMVWISSKMARFLKNFSFPTSWEFQHTCTLHIHIHVHDSSLVSRPIPSFQYCILNAGNEIIIGTCTLHDTKVYSIHVCMPTMIYITLVIIIYYNW